MGGEGLVRRAPPPPKPVRRGAGGAGGSHPLARRPPVPPAGRLTLAGLPLSGCSVVIDTEWQEVAAAEEAAVAPNTTVTGIVPVSLLGVEEREPAAAPKHPRRTRRVSSYLPACLPAG